MVEKDFFATTHGCSAVHVAAQHGSSEVITALRDAGAEMSRTDAAGRTAAHYAAASGHTEVLSVLMRAGLKLSAKDRLGRCALVSCH